MGRYSLVVWDWNGTLLNDRHLCIEVVNGMLSRRGIATLNDRRYLDLFTFPIIEYYRRIGFDYSRDPFPELAVEYLSEYDARVAECDLHPGAPQLIREIAVQGTDQVILSASEQRSLENALDAHGIREEFLRVRGLRDGHAASKVDAGHALLDSIATPRNQTIMIGDTDHDVEVADSLGIDVVLVAAGHQARERLEETGRRVFRDFAELSSWVRAAVRTQ
jgi:phosphoglycolate phosphatase